MVACEGTFSSWGDADLIPPLPLLAVNRPPCIKPSGGQLSACDVVAGTWTRVSPDACWHCKARGNCIAYGHLVDYRHSFYKKPFFLVLTIQRNSVWYTEQNWLASPQPCHGWSYCNSMLNLYAYNPSLLFTMLQYGLCAGSGVSGRAPIRLCGGNAWRVSSPLPLKGWGGT